MILGNNSKAVELWLPTSQTIVQVVDGKVTIWDEMTMEKTIIRKPAGFGKEQA